MLSSGVVTALCAIHQWALRSQQKNDFVQRNARDGWRWGMSRSMVCQHTWWNNDTDVSWLPHYPRWSSMTLQFHPAQETVSEGYYDFLSHFISAKLLWGQCNSVLFCLWAWFQAGAPACSWRGDQFRITTIRWVSPVSCILSCSISLTSAAVEPVSPRGSHHPAQISVMQTGEV